MTCTKKQNLTKMILATINLFHMVQHHTMKRLLSFLWWYLINWWRVVICFICQDNVWQGVTGTKCVMCKADFDDNFCHIFSLNPMLWASLCYFSLCCRWITSNFFVILWKLIGSCYISCYLRFFMRFHKRWSVTRTWFTRSVFEIKLRTDSVLGSPNYLPGNFSWSHQRASMC